MCNRCQDLGYTGKGPERKYCRACDKGRFLESVGAVLWGWPLGKKPETPEERTVEALRSYEILAEKGGAA